MGFSFNMDVIAKRRGKAAAVYQSVGFKSGFAGAGKKPGVRNKGAFFPGKKSFA